MSGSVSSRSARPAFSVAAKPKPSRRKRTPPVSIRFSDEELAWLEKRTGGVPVSRYIKDAVLSGSGVKRKPKRRMPVKDHEALARVLSLLGRSETGRMLGGILFALELGKLELDDQTEADLRQACADVASMRNALMTALELPQDRKT